MNNKMQNVNADEVLCFHILISSIFIICSFFICSYFLSFLCSAFFAILTYSFLSGFSKMKIAWPKVNNVYISLPRPLIKWIVPYKQGNNFPRHNIFARSESVIVGYYTLQKCLLYPLELILLEVLTCYGIHTRKRVGISISKQRISLY